MIYSAIKKARLLRSMTQAQVAHALGISQPNYQRWESGTSPVPSGKLEKLAKVLGATVNQILGKQTPFDILGNNKSVEDDRTYFGEVTIHFSNGTLPLLLSLSEEARTNLYRDITDEGGFICVESLENQMVFIRRSAIADIYFSSDAYDDYGPEVYEQSLGLLPDDSFWRVVEFSDCLDAIEDDIDKIFIDEVISKILLSEVDLAKLKSSQDLSDQELNQIKEDADKLNQRFINRAQNISWQLSSGKQRSENVNENRLIYDVFGTFKFENLDPIICLPVEDYHRTIFINTSVVDYISIPAHKFRDGEIECLENEIDRSERK